MTMDERSITALFNVPIEHNKELNGAIQELKAENERYKSELASKETQLLNMEREKKQCVEELARKDELLREIEQKLSGARSVNTERGGASGGGRRGAADAIVKREDLAE